jgi:hypothetical protein
MRRIPITVSCAAVALGGLLGTASASPAASASASCVGVITSNEGTQLPPGSIGREVSGLARSAPGLGSALVAPLAHEHGGRCG